jgi:GrpB-like predicted nucleotidyltransferase (UPF0157 family)
MCRKGFGYIMTGLEKVWKDTLMQIIGGQQVIVLDSDSENLIKFYRSLFDRLTKEVKNTGNLTRYVGYQSTIDGKDYLCFFGIEVDSIEDIPEGMVAWDISDNVRTIWASKDGCDVITSQEKIGWQWIDKSPPSGGRCTGEFSLLERTSGYHNFRLSANAYVELQKKDVSSDEVYLVDYDPSWPQQFDEIAGWLRDGLGPDIALRVEHYGSTAIAGMPAKSIIDVLVEIPSFSKAKPQAIPLLNRQEWEYWWYSDHMIFIKRDKLMGWRTHHIHMVPQGHKLWEGLTFRDYLRNHNEDALCYAALKQDLAETYRDDREQYTQAKTMFVKEILSKAL